MSLCVWRRTAPLRHGEGAGFNSCLSAQGRPGRGRGWCMMGYGGDGFEPAEQRQTEAEMSHHPEWSECISWPADDLFGPSRWRRVFTESGGAFEKGKQTKSCFFHKQKEGRCFADDSLSVQGKLVWHSTENQA